MTRVNLPSTVTFKRVADLCTLSAFGITQPLLAALSKQTVYLHDQQVEWLEIGVLLSLLVIALPFCFVVIDALVQRFSCWTRGYGRNAVLVVLLSIVLFSLSRPYLVYTQMFLAVPLGVLVPTIVVLLSSFLIGPYEKRKWLQAWLSWMSVGVLIFPLTFLWQFEPYSPSRPDSTSKKPAKSPVPVVMIIFDEFSCRTLLDERMQIDGQRFPQFARLAGISTWYRNASTVSPRTDIAVPAILSGNFPTVDRPPLADDYPGNLFELIEGSGSFEMTVFEPVTRLSAKTIRRERPIKRSQLQKCIDLVHTLAAVYPRLIFTLDTPIWFPTIPRPWFGLPALPVGRSGSTTDALTGRLLYGGGEYRGRQLDHFIRCLIPSMQPGFRFLHVVLPHYPWTFLPSGEQYESEFRSPEIPAGARGELGELWDDDPITVARNEYRYRLQVGFVDRFVGELLDRLEETRLLDSSLLIVTADHGVSFRPGHSRRLPDADTLPDILSIPLFVKLPGQTIGRVDDRNVESVDLLPTILETVGLDIPDSVDGIPVSREHRQPRKSFYFQSNMTICEPDYLLQERLRREHAQTYRSTELDQLADAALSHPQWRGQSVSQFAVDEAIIPVKRLDHNHPNPTTLLLASPQIVPRFMSGILSSSEVPVVPAQVLLTVDGIIVDTGQTSWIEYDKHGFQLFIPESVVPVLTGNVELFLVDTSQSVTRLVRLGHSD